MSEGKLFDYRDVWNKRVFYEVFSIFFGVSVALLLDQWNDNRNNLQDAADWKMHILKEVQANKKNIEKMLPSHELTYHFIDSLIEQKVDLNNIGDYSPFIDVRLIQSSSWETAKLVQAISHMDIQMMQRMAKVYDYQDYYDEILKERTQRVLTANANLSDELRLHDIHSMFKAIIPMEQQLVLYYDYLLDKYDQKAQQTIPKMKKKSSASKAPIN